jgi:hypothetical protein
MGDTEWVCAIVEMKWQGLVNVGMDELISEPFMLSMTKA